MIRTKAVKICEAGAGGLTHTVGSHANGWARLAVLQRLTLSTRVILPVNLVHPLL